MTFKTVLKGLIFCSMLLNCSNIKANPPSSTYTWEGTTDSDLSKSANWLPNISDHPAAGDSAIFNSSIPPGSFTPTVSAASSTNAFAIDLAQFTSPSSLFAFIITDPNSKLTFAGTGPGPVYGVQNNSGIEEIFNVNNSGQIIFQNKCSADSSSGTSPGLIIYNVGDATTPGSIAFQNQSDAGEAFFLLKSNSTLTFQDESSAGQAIINTNDADVVNLAQDANGTFEASVIGTGSINKTGFGTINFLSNNAVFNGKTNVYNGAFLLNNLLGGDLNVYSGGIFGGEGTLSGKASIESGGTLAPGNGNDIGTLTINNDLLQQTNSIFLIQTDGSGNASKVNVGGQTSINAGALVNVMPQAVQLAPNEEFTATILTSGAGVSGTYDSAISSNPLIAVELSYDPNDVFLTWTNALSLIGKTSNQRHVTDQLQTLNAAPIEDLSVLASLVQLSSKEQQHALNQITAQPYANMLLAAELSNTKFIRRLYNPLREINTWHACCEVDDRNPCCCMAQTWIDGGWNHSNFKGNRNAKGFSLSGYEVSLGIQTTIESCWTVGLAGSYENEQLKYKVGGSGRVNTYLGGLYSLYRPADYYILGDLVLGWSQNKIKRHIDIDTYHFRTHSKPDVFQGSLYVEAGQDYALDCFLFQPFVGIEAGYFRHDHIHEHGSESMFKVNVNNKSLGSASSRLGLHMLTEASCFKMYIDAAWQYRLTSLRNHSRERFQEFGDEFSITGTPLARSSFDAAINLSTTVMDGWEFYVEGEGQWWNKASSYTLLAGLLLTW